MALFGRNKNQKRTSAGGEKKETEPVETSGVAGGKEEIKTAVQLPKGADSHAYEVIYQPHTTEKGSVMGALNKYVFKVRPDSGKIEIKNAIEKLYKVKVSGVNIISVPAKARKIARHEGWKTGYKKAIVTLKEGNKIETLS